jgi:hypothetical protein
MSGDVVKSEVVDIQALISQGIKDKASMDIMERMFALAEKADKIRAERAFFESLAKFQSEIKPIIKKEKVNDTNGKEVYSYATLDQIVEQVKKPLADNGFSYTFDAPPVEGKISVTVEAHHINGYSKTMTLTASGMTGKYMNEVQGQGSILTYLKRYSFCGIFGIMTADADTDAVSKPQEEKPAEKPQGKKSVTDGMTEEAKKLYNDIVAELTRRINIDAPAKDKVEEFNKLAGACIKDYKSKQLQYFTLDELKNFHAFLLPVKK